MKKALGILLALFCVLTSSVAGAAVKIRPSGLKCEHLEMPVGIDDVAPRLSWRMEDSRKGAVQTAYRVIVGTYRNAVEGGSGDCWDTGKVESCDMLVRYSGKALEPFTGYWWRVTAWDKEGKEHSSEPAYFETGMMDMENWTGEWISDGRDIEFGPAPYFRKEFTIEPGVLQQARAYISAAGLYELYINGKKVGDHRLDPLYTRFDRRNLYVTYDVTDYLQEGRNVAGVMLGNGWYNHQSGAVWDFDRAPWRDRPAFCLDIRVTCKDGTTMTVASGEDWKVGYGALLFNSIYTSEHYDARLEQKGWAERGFDDSGWDNAIRRDAPSANVTAQKAVPIRNVTEYKARYIKRLDENSWLFDFGQNMSGVTRLRLSGEEGTKVRLIHTERLHTDGHADQSNIDVYFRPKNGNDFFQTDIVTLSGNGEDEFMPRFNYKGFRYVEVVTDRPVEMKEGNLTAYFMHSDVEPAGLLETSEDIVNRLWKATNMSYLSNLMGYPTDCPQREKNGWTGDGHLAIETGLYNFDSITVYEKWMADHRDEQRPDGVLPDIIPTGGWGYGTANGLDWTSTIAIIPWTLYTFYGDTRPLEDCYENIKRYVDYVDRNSPEGLSSWGRGDWVPVRSHSSLELTSSVYFFVDATILSKAAALLGKEDDFRYYSSLAGKIRSAINAKYLDREKGIYASGCQTELSVPLYWGVCPDEFKAAVAANLAKDVEAQGYHIDVGVLGARAVLNALSENGYHETAYRLATQDTYPSWGNWIVNGDATTLLENWDLNAPRDISDNHMMFGDIGGWFFRGLAGIRPDPAVPGFRHIVLTPSFTGPERLSASHLSPYGNISVSWKLSKGKVKYNVEVPAGCTATLVLPENVQGETMELVAGKHEFTFGFKAI
ncbi:MAG: glycoside hydrolase family 78 protein [Clostridium sp.]|nr:glycoside hydrolase family 78 protein [Bacteroides sp.]MCM1197431.1 glycoside hydrolase family 78 protein [Clostridium sp.]